MHHEMNRCLDVPDHPANDFKMLNTYVTKLPQGNETGQYLALDLGGTNYRVLLITFGADSSEPTIEYDTERIPPELMTGKGDDLS
nr:hexokinase [Hymenolepis microstoma]